MKGNDLVIDGTLEGITTVALTTGAFTVNVNLPEYVALAASRTVTVYSIADVYTLALPEIIPVLVLIDKPVGNAGEIVYAYDPAPP